MKLTTHFHLELRSLRGAIPPLPKYSSMAWWLVKHRDNITFTFPCNSMKNWQLQSLDLSPPGFPCVGLQGKQGLCTQVDTKDELLQQIFDVARCVDDTTGCGSQLMAAILNIY
jgi:hypothetical protein